MPTFEEACLSFVHNVCAAQSRFNSFNCETVIRTTDCKIHFCTYATLQNQAAAKCSTLTVDTVFSFTLFNPDSAIIC